jgi:hypothetical protein
MIGRWRAAAHHALGEVHGLVRVLMKPRNELAWTVEDRVFLRGELRRLARWTPALALFLLPGTFLLLPAWVWLLDRRRHARRTAPANGREASPGR